MFSKRFHCGFRVFFSRSSITKTGFFQNLYFAKKILFKFTSFFTIVFFLKKRKNASSPSHRRAELENYAKQYEAFHANRDVHGHNFKY